MGNALVGLAIERIMVTNMDADAQVPLLYVQEVDRAAAAAEDPHLLVRCCPALPCKESCGCSEPIYNLGPLAITGPLSS